MSSFVTVLFWFALFISISEQAKHSKIAVNSPANGTNMLYNVESVTTNANEWTVTFATQQSYDLVLKLNNEWGFDTHSPSHITLTFNGTNYNSDEGDLLFVFSVSNIQYFGVVIRNEISGQLYKVYPEPFRSALPELINNSVTSSIISPATPDRWDRITNSTIWYNTIPVYRNPVDIALKWPIKLTILNDPITNTVRYSQTDFTTDTELYSTTYLSSFYSNNGMDIYIMSDGVGESFGIYDVEIEYQVQITPTYNPTLEPTLFPSLSFTTQIPTNIATTTLHPTLEPTIIYNTETMISTNTKYYKTTQSEHSIHINIESYDSDVLIVLIVAVVLGVIYCVFTILLLFYCVRSQRYEQRKSNNNEIDYHLPRMQCVTSPINNINIKLGSETCSESHSETDQSKVEEKEGELITTDLPVINNGEHNNNKTSNFNYIFK